MLTIIISSHNEEANIKACIESAQNASSQIVVVDQESTDKTALIAAESGAQVISSPHTRYVEPAREYAVHQAKTPWVFILDADERITAELGAELKQAIRTEHFTHYRVPRKNIFGQKIWLKHGGWWPDCQIRLIKKDALTIWPTDIHSTPRLSGSEGVLENPLLHYFHGDFENMVKKTLLFEDIESELLYKAGRNVSTVTFFRKFLGEFYRRLFKHAGFLDGPVGIMEAVYQAFSKTVTYLILYEKKKIRPLHSVS